MSPFTSQVLSGLGFNLEAFRTIMRIDLSEHELQALILSKLGSLGGESGGNLTVVSPVDDYTLVLADEYVRMNKATAVSCTVPPNSSVAFPIGKQIAIRAVDLGQVSLQPGAGVTINSPDTLKLQGMASTATLIKVGADEWDLVGDLEPVSP